MNKRSGTRRRGVSWKRVVVALLLGAVVNVLVAWGFVLWATYKPERRVAAGDRQIGRLGYPDPFVELREDMFQRAQVNGGEGYSEMSYSMLDVRSPEQVRMDNYSGTRAGWPVWCFRADWWDDMTSGVFGAVDLDPVPLGRRIAMGIRVNRLPRWVQRIGVGGLPTGQYIGLHATRPPPNQRVHSSFYARTIPLRPMPLGFMANTLFYATPFLLLFGFPALRRRRRRRRGLCAWCAYDRAGMSAEKVCPECGGPGSSVLG